MRFFCILYCLGSVSFADHCPDVPKIRSSFASSGKGRMVMTDVQLQVPHQIEKFTPEAAASLQNFKFFFEPNGIVFQTGCKWLRKRLLGPKFLIRDYSEDHLQIVVDEDDARRAIRRKYDILASAVQLASQDLKPTSQTKPPVRRSQQSSSLTDAIAEVMVVGMIEGIKLSLAEAASNPEVRRQLIDQAVEKEIRVLKDSEYTLTRRTDQRYELTYQSIAQSGNIEIPFVAIYQLSWDGESSAISQVAAALSQIAQRQPSAAPR